MGGGAAMRAAAKVAGITAATGGIRGITAEHISAGRRAGSLRPAAATMTAEDVKLAAPNNEAGVQRPCLEVDDWVFAGGEGEVLVSAGNPMPRVVFGGAPSLQEAKEATSELAAALEEVYQSSPNSVGYEGSVIETKACVSSEIAIPSPAITAFRFLQESPAVQNAVASIACDQNVWNAVLQNQELQMFLHSQKTYLSNSDMNFHTEVIEADSYHLDKLFVNESPDSEPDGGIMNNILKKIKSAVVGMMSNLSDYFQSFFGGKGANGVFVNSDGTAKWENAMGASFMGLAVMAILVILLKRPIPVIFLKRA